MRVKTLAIKLIVCGRQRVHELEPRNPGIWLVSAVAIVSQLLALSMQTEWSYPHRVTTGSA